MFKKLKKLFIVEDVSGKKTIGDQSAKSDRFSGKVGGNGKKTEISSRSIEQFIRVLADEIEKNNIEGYDYLEFKEAVKSLNKLESDEEKRFITAFTLAKTMGAEKKSLIKSAEFYLEILQSEEAKFKSALKKQIDHKLLTGREKMSKLELTITSKKEKIKKMQEEIKKNQLDLDKLKLNVKGSAEKVEKVKLSFNAAYKSVVGQINNDLNKIEKYLK